MDPETLRWEKAYVDMMKSRGTGTGSAYVPIVGGQGKVFFDAEFSFDSELNRSVAGDIPLFTVVFILMSALTALALSGWHPSRMRILVVAAGVSLTFLAIAAGYGSMSLVGVPMTSIVFILPFVLVGIGVDDMVVIVKAFDATKGLTRRVPFVAAADAEATAASSFRVKYVACVGRPQRARRRGVEATEGVDAPFVDVPLTVPERAEMTLQRVGVSITLTTVTDVAAFMLGSFTKLPAVYWFCYYACACLVINFALVVTAFVSFLALDTHRMDWGGVELLWCCFRCAPKGWTCWTWSTPKAAAAAGERAPTRCLWRDPALGEGLRCICVDAIRASTSKRVADEVVVASGGDGVVELAPVVGTGREAVDGAREAEGEDGGAVAATEDAQKEEMPLQAAATSTAILVADRLEADGVLVSSPVQQEPAPAPLVRCSAEWWLRAVICPLGPPVPLRALTKEERAKCGSEGCLPTTMRAVYAPALLNLPVAIIVVLCFCGLTSLSAVGIASVGQGFDVIDLMPDTSYTRQFFIEGRKAFGWSPAFGLSVITQTLPYEQPATQVALRAVVSGAWTEVDTTPCVLSGVIVGSWLHDVSTWLNTTYPSTVTCTTFAPFGPSDVHCSVPAADFYTKLFEFVALPQYRHFKNDLVFAAGATYNATTGAPTSGTIRAARMFISHTEFSNSEEQVACLSALERYGDSRADSVGGGVILYAYPHVFWDQVRAALDPAPFASRACSLGRSPDARLSLTADARFPPPQYRIIYPELLQNFGLSLVAIAVVSLVFLVHPMSAVIITAVVAIIDVDLLGFVHYWGHQVNSITTVNLVMAIGLVVDYSAHIMHSFGVQPTRDPLTGAVVHRAKRVQSALGQMGVSIVLGGVTTFVGVMPCAFAGSEVFRVFFHMFVDIIAFGLLHGLVLVPILLCAVGMAVDSDEASWVWAQCRERCPKAAATAVSNTAPEDGDEAAVGKAAATAVSENDGR